ncbi:MAG TPA: hypothetical protein VGI12_09690 [Vicinamibacterales bacterium]
MGDAGVVEAGERRQQFEQQAEAGVEARDDPLVGRRVEQVRQPASRTVAGDDRQSAIRLHFDAARPGEALVFEAGDDRQPLLQRPGKDSQFGPQAQPFAYLAALAIEHEHTPAETVFIAGRRLGRGGVGRGHVQRSPPGLQPAHHRAICVSAPIRLAGVAVTAGMSCG